MVAPASLREDYWETFEFQDDDLDFLYNHLLDIETPQTPPELLRAIVEERIRKEKKNLEAQQQANGTLYLPKDQHEPGDKLVFPALNWQSGKVTAKRKAINPDLPPFQVLEVTMESSEKRCFASELEQHILNVQPAGEFDDPNLDKNEILNKYGKELIRRMSSALESNPELVQIAGRWFPRALLVDVNIGHMNLAEALLDMEGGGPLATRKILDQIELPTDVNPKLTEFSLNHALQEDGRFDEVGPAGEVLWYLRRLEPEGVQNPPIYLKYSPINFNPNTIQELSYLLHGCITDELESSCAEPSSGEAVVSLIFPHWRAGSLPLADNLRELFPTAYESPRIRFTFVTENGQSHFPGWVVLKSKYVYGLANWYAEQGLMPGSQVHFARGKKPGEVIIRTEKRRSTRDWVRTALIGADGGIVFAMLKQLVTANYDERMAIALPDVDALDKIWKSGGRQKQPLEKTVIGILREMTKLNPQGHVHAQELYAAVNLVRRCPPSPILSTLESGSWATYLGDLYYRLEEAHHEDDGHE